MGWPGPTPAGVLGETKAQTRKDLFKVEEVTAEPKRDYSRWPGLCAGGTRYLLTGDIQTLKSQETKPPSPPPPFPPPLPLFLPVIVF